MCLCLCVEVVCVCVWRVVSVHLCVECGVRMWVGWYVFVEGGVCEYVWILVCWSVCKVCVYVEGGVCKCVEGGAGFLATGYIPLFSTISRLDLKQ